MDVRTCGNGPKARSVCDCRVFLAGFDFANCLCYVHGNVVPHRTSNTKAYVHPEDNQLQSLALSTAAVTLFVAIILRASEVEGSRMGSVASNLGVLLIILQAIVFGCAIYLVVSAKVMPTYR